MDGRFDFPGTWFYKRQPAAVVFDAKEVKIGPDTIQRWSIGSDPAASGLLTLTVKRRQLRTGTWPRSGGYRSVAQQMRTERLLKQITNPFNEDNRKFIQTRWGLVTPPDGTAAVASSCSPQKQLQQRRQSPERKGRLVRATWGHPVILPKLFREDPHAFPYLTPQHARQGVFGLLNRGVVPPYLDMTPAFKSHPPLSAAPAPLHSHHEATAKTLPASVLDQRPWKFDRSALQQEQAEEGEQPATVQHPEAKLAEPEAPHSSCSVERSGSGVLLPSAGPSQLGQQDRQQQEEEEPRLRGYEQLLDAYSLHRFMIRKGRLVNSTPEFASFQRKYTAIWLAVMRIIHQLEMLCVQLRLELVHVSGQRVVELAQTGRPQFPASELLFCFENMDRAVLAAKLSAKRYKGPQGRELAATKIQSVWRMYRHRKAYKVRQAWLDD